MVKIYVDVREKESDVPKYLSELGVTVVFKQLSVGDYVIAERVIAERKSVSDLAKSVFDGRFFNQLSRLTREAERCFLIVEGGLERLKNLTSNYRAVQAALYYSSVISRVPIILTDSPRHTAEILKYFSLKLQEAPKALSSVSRLRNKPRDVSIAEWQIYVLSALPGVGVKTAEKLLKRFGSVKNVFNASIPELISVEGISEDKASLIFRVINELYTRKQVRSLESFTEKNKKEGS
ncbi:MAG: ERCC4 domain-containing protein [Sulfolobales archaeon]|nr:helix-hairpin-helix domain-containing protein [Sulfolobales archaeon]MDW8082445.1 ERCC4 domain-containing protein [Sulfolobales archaeon]